MTVCDDPVMLGDDDINWRLDRALNRFFVYICTGNKHAW